MAAVQVEGLTKRYGDRTVVDDVSFAVDEGELFGILGPNGAGKTTTVECVAGLRRPDGGRVAVGGLDPQRDGPELRTILGIQLQASRLPEKLKVWEALDLYSSFYDEPADWRDLMDRLGVSQFRDVAYGKLSGGQKQRVSIALALVGRPRVAILDELTTGLDPQARRDTWALIEQIRDEGVTILLVTHFMEEAERLCERVAVIAEGRVRAIDSPAGLVRQVTASQSVRFVPSAELDDRLLTELDEVEALSRRGREVTVTGTGNLLHALTSVLARHQIVAEQLRVDQPGLDDAYLALTGRAAEADVEEGGR